MFPSEEIILLDNDKGRLAYTPNFLAPEEAHQLYSYLSDNMLWLQEEIRIFGRWIMQPRLTSLYGDEGLSYTYSGRTMYAQPWDEQLFIMKQRIEQYSGYTFNTVLGNWYRNGQDSMGYHADDEPVFGENPVVASLTLGAVRNFDLKMKDGTGEKIRLGLESGSLLMMSGALQHNYVHQLPKTAKVNEGRINLTFRRIIIEQL